MSTEDTAAADAGAATETVPVEQFQRALASRAEIDQAKGILIALYRVSSDAAWQMLSSSSQRWNIKLRLLAEALVAVMTGEEPPDARAAGLARQLLPGTRAGGGDKGFTAQDRRLLGDVRDDLADGRDVAARRRDGEADARSSYAGRRELVVGAAADRAAAQRDRRSSAVDRHLAAEDRAAAEAAETKPRHQ